MKTISLIIYEEAVLSSISGALDLLIATNGYLQQQGKPAAFRVELVGEKAETIQLHVPAHFVCYKTLEEITHTDLILIPAFYGSPDQALAKNKGIVNWLSRQYKEGIEVASL
ncbi:type 1 glutamine amidotransferase family protein [Spirosoma rigui]|uniref:hypothetical protein n=1 Tax=Spirosoma rigui TaxID=564064 RepID=UPI001FE465DE|nr:hypothetical protein [Spirosoma rigui]